MGGVTGHDGGSCGDDVSVNVEGNLWSQYVFNTYHRNNETVGGGVGRRAMTLNRLPGLSPSNAVYKLLQNPKLTQTAALAAHRYPAAWTGDIYGDFSTLAAHVALFAEAAGTMLFTHYSADLGGFRSTYPEGRARTAAPHCGSHCRPRTAAPPLLIALSPRTACLPRHTQARRAWRRTRWSAHVQGGIRRGGGRRSAGVGMGDQKGLPGEKGHLS